MNGTTGIESPSAAAAPVRSSESADRYTTTAVILHWLIAVMVIGMIAFGWWMQQVPNDAVSQAFRMTYLVTSWVLVVAIALHVAAALKQWCACLSLV
jgi:cytochrome b561